MATSTASSQGEPSTSVYNLNVPSALLTLPPTAAFIGLIIGFSRGGSTARLRFLAENVHRKPTTLQGWYFYTKTRNYRVMLGALKGGGRYASLLGLGGVAYVLADESAGWAREQVLGPRGESSSSAGGLSGSGNGKGRALQGEDEEGGWGGRRMSWREGEPAWEDGAVAGSLLGLAVGFAGRLPSRLFLRAVMMGAVLGGATSGLQIGRDRLRALRDEEERAERERRAEEARRKRLAEVIVVAEPERSTAEAEEKEAQPQTDDRYFAQVGRWVRSWTEPARERRHAEAGAGADADEKKEKTS